MAADSVPWEGQGKGNSSHLLRPTMLLWGPVKSGWYTHSPTESPWKVLSTSFTVHFGNLTSSVMKTNRKIPSGSSTCAEFSQHSYLQLKLLSLLIHRARNVELDSDENPWLAGAGPESAGALLPASSHQSPSLPPRGTWQIGLAPQYSSSAISSLSKGLGTPALTSLALFCPH